MVLVEGNGSSGGVYVNGRRIDLGMLAAWLGPAGAGLAALLA